MKKSQFFNKIKTTIKTKPSVVITITLLVLLVVALIILQISNNFIYNILFVWENARFILIMLGLVGLIIGLMYFAWKNSKRE